MTALTEAVEAEDAVLLVAVLTSKEEDEICPSESAITLCDVALALGAAREGGLGTAVAANVARATLHTEVLGAPRGRTSALLPPGELTHALDEQLDTLSELWNSIVPEEFHVNESHELSDAILLARRETCKARKDATMTQAAADFAATRARDMRAEIATVAIGALEADVRERARPRCAGDAAAARAIARGNAVLAKLRLLRASVAAQLYDAPAVRALRDAAEVLDNRVAELKPKAAVAAENIARYRAVEQEHDEEFGKIVRDYKNLSSALEEKQWSLKELGVQ